MAGKSSKLAQGVNRTGNGLFRGMTAINSAKAEEKEAGKKSNDISKSEEISDIQIDKNADKGETLTETVGESDEKKAARISGIMQDNLHNEESVVREAANNELNQAAAVTENAEERVFEVNNRVASTASELVQYEPELSNEQVSEPVSDFSEPIREAASDQASRPVSESSGRRTRAADVKDMRDTADSASSKGKGSSRYEKEKFLLLDIRGYRDYVEHMAKAANMSATKYIRNLIQQDMDMNMDIYEAHKALEEKLKGRVTR